MKVTFEQLSKGITLATGMHHTLVLDQIETQALELDEVCFGFDSAVLLPSLPEMPALRRPESCGSRHWWR